MSLEYHIELSYPTSESPTHPPMILRIPYEDILKQTTNVEAWLLYLGFCVCGVSGSLRTSDGTTISTRNLLQLVENGAVCTYIPSSDVKVVAWTHDLKSRRHPPAAFSAGCKERDGGCVLQNTFRPSDYNDLSEAQRARREALALKGCQAFHLLPVPHDYMDLISQARAPHPNDYISDVDDIRNGLTMNSTLHTVLITQYGAAFLHVPNAYMQVEDAVLHDLDARAEDEVHCHFMPDEVRDSPDVFIRVDTGRLWDNKCLRQPKDRAHWPLSYLWDFIFGVAVIKNWATAESLVEMADEKYGAYRNSDDGDVTEAEGEVGAGVVDGYDIWDIMACIMPAHRVPKDEAHERVTRWLSAGMGS